MISHFTALRKEYAWPFAIVVVGRLGLFIFAYVALSIMPNYDPGPVTWDLFGDNRWLNGWARWDAGWYKDIAEHGYSTLVRYEDQENIHFFPLYPAAIRAVRLMIPHTGLAGLLISNVSFLVAMLFVFAIVKKIFDVETAKLTLILASVYPFSFYFSAMYPEALFMALTAASLFFAHRSQWAIAAVLAALSSATRLVGIALSVGLVVLYLEQIHFEWRRIRPNILWLALAPMGVVGYFLFLHYRYDALLVLFSERDSPGWTQDIGLAFRSMWSVNAIVTGGWKMMNIFNLFVGIGVMIPVLLKWRKLPLAYTVWMIVFFIVSYMGNWFNMGRYMAPAFPIYIATALLCTRVEATYAMIYLSTLALALLTFLYTHWYWVT